MTIYKIRFKRTKDSIPENGIRIEGFDNDLIIDNKGVIVEGMIYNADYLHYDFCIDLKPILKD